jgi:hypothetical protein
LHTASICCGENPLNARIFHTLYTPLRGLFLTFEN